MKKFLVLVLFSVFGFSQDGLPHCGYDFTTYLVANPIDATTKKIIDSLQITLVDASGNEVVNTNNEFSLINKDKSLLVCEKLQSDVSKFRSKMVL